MYELLILSLLIQFPLHAYLIAHITNDIIGPWERIGRGNLSALFSKLEQAGYITPADPAQVPFSTDRPSRAFAITPLGRKRFRRLMLDTTSNLGAYQRLFRIKALHLEFLSFEDQLFLVDHYVTYCQTALHYQQTEAQEFASDPLKQEHLSSLFRVRALDLMELLAHQWQLELTWARHLREHIVSMQTEKGRPS